ncbi:MAG: pantetheine-phosphate adenylyltransferase [Bdellovibrionales bacterium]|nr:pantetheine-phosphate adenylyltransferase [Bdellovibrionales bacterium]
MTDHSVTNPGTGLTVIFPGSFDPVTRGHVATVREALRISSKVIVAIGCNPEKPRGEFTIDERRELLSIAMAEFGNSVNVEAFPGSLAVFARELGLHTVVRGLRDGFDLVKEQQVAFANRILGEKLGHELSTQFVTPPPDTQQVSSTLVRQLMNLSDIPSDVLREVLNEILPAGVADAILSMRPRG